ncbi:MAG TPA: hypothetical protein GXZ82_10945 [Firmicutes bacterium]|nr:hypothetical protein [Bacillota bacterium]
MVYANLYQAAPFADRDDLINAANVGVILRLAEDPQAELSEPEQEAAALLVGTGVISNNQGILQPQLPVMSTAVWSEIRSLIDTAVRETADLSAAAKVGRLADDILLPHVRKDLLEEYVNWIMLSCLSPLNYVLFQCHEEGLLQIPKDYQRTAAALYLRKI